MAGILSRLLENYDVLCDYGRYVSTDKKQVIDRLNVTPERFRSSTCYRFDAADDEWKNSM